MNTLRSCPADLTVTVGGGEGVGSGWEGEEEQVFMYPKAVLANASEYIDTMLSVPMQEQEACAISFPDIQPKQWLKWTNYVFDPVGANKMNICDNDNTEMLFFYDKYQFRSGVRLVDYTLSENIRLIIQDATLSRRQPKALIKLLQVVKAFISEDGAIDFPLTKNVLPAFALGLFYYEKNLEGLFFFVNPKLKLPVPLLLPYVFDATNIDLGPVIPDIVDIAYGAAINERSREELKAIVLEDSFFPKLKIKLLQTKQLTDMLSNLKIRHINIDCSGVSPGRYKGHKRKDYGLGAMNCWYSRTIVVIGGDLEERTTTFVVQAMDGIGSTWTHSAHVRGREVRCGTTDHNSILLNEWHNEENMTSILPPKKGWSRTSPAFDEEAFAVLGQTYSGLFRLSYDIND